MAIHVTQTAMANNNKNVATSSTIISVRFHLLGVPDRDHRH
jgi:hypothetical protein